MYVVAGYFSPELDSIQQQQKSVYVVKIDTIGNVHPICRLQISNHTHQ